MSSSADRDDDGLADAVAALATRARRRNRARVEQVVRLLGPAGEAVEDPEARDHARRLCHAVAGSAGTFGDDELAESARDLEDTLDESPAVDEVVAMVGRLRDAVPGDERPDPTILRES